MVVSLNRPGGNLTGISGQAPDIVGKRLQILLELIPANRIVAVLLNPDTPASTLVLSETPQCRPAAESEARSLRGENEPSPRLGPALRPRSRKMQPDCLRSTIR